MDNLNLKWVSETIGEEYKKWSKGDIVTIQAQTGTGKTYFVKNVLVPYLDKYEHMLIVSNRVNLKRQIKIDLLRLCGKEIPEDLEELDKITTVGNVTLLSYHQIAIMKKAQEEKGKELNLDIYKYIVLDECHWFKTDASFCDKTELAWKELIKTRHENSITIYISATMEEIRPMIDSAIKKFNEKSFGSSIELWNYTTGIDYNYLNPYYFDKIENLAIHIKNADIKDGKWLVFVTSKSMANKLNDIITNKKVTIITAETKEDNEELQSIINDSKFNSDVLICTKVLDNGVNIQDEEVKNIVINSWDKTTFIQELGRIRINIDNPYEIDLYIPMKSKKAFTSRLMGISKDIDILNLYEHNKKEFMFKYRDNKNKLPNHLFYVKDNKGYVINKLGYANTYSFNKFLNDIINKWDDKKNKDKSYTFIKEQLSWIGLEDTFNGLYSKIIDEYDCEEVNKLEEWLNEHIEEKLFTKEQQELSDLIIKELTTIGNNVDYRTKKLKPKTIEVILREQLDLNYAIGKTIKESKGENRGKRYIVISKIK